MYKAEKIIIIKHSLDVVFIYRTEGPVSEVNNEFVRIFCRFNSTLMSGELEINGKKVLAKEILNSRNIRLEN